MKYLYGTTKKERVWLTLPIRQAPGYITTNVNHQIVQHIRTALLSTIRERVEGMEVQTLSGVFNGIPTGKDLISRSEVLSLLTEEGEKC